MNRIAITAAVIVLSTSSLVLGSEIVYKPASDDINTVALLAIDTLFKTNKKVQLEHLAGRVICGPGLWRVIRQSPKIASLKLTPATSMVAMGNGKYEPFEGALFQMDHEKIELVKIVRDILGDTKFRVRKPNRREKTIYWSLISYDIEEPIFVLDNESRKIMLDFVVTENGVEILWIGDMSQFGVGEDGS